MRSVMLECNRRLAALAVEQALPLALAALEVEVEGVEGAEGTSASSVAWLSDSERLRGMGAAPISLGNEEELKAVSG